MLDLLSFNGRRTRGSFVRLMIVLTIVFFAVILGVGTITIPMQDGASAEEKAAASSLGKTLLTCFILPYWWVCFAITVQRLHDLNMGAIYLMMLGVPYENLRLIYRLVAKPGKKAPNRFGPAPGSGSAYAAPVKGEPLPPAPRTSMRSLVGLFSDDVLESAAEAVGLSTGGDEPERPMRSMRDYDPPIRLRVAEEPSRPGSSLAGPASRSPFESDPPPSASEPTWDSPNPTVMDLGTGRPPRRRAPRQPSKPTFGRRQT